MVKHRAYKVELKPTSEQRQIIERTMGVCRFVYDLFRKRIVSCALSFYCVGRSPT